MKNRIERFVDSGYSVYRYNADGKLEACNWEGLWFRSAFNSLTEILAVSKLGHRQSDFYILVSYSETWAMKTDKDEK